MIQDRISLILKDLNNLKLELKEIRKTLKNLEKIDSQEYDDIKRAYKDLRKQMKSFEETWQNELLDDQEYVTMREMKEKKEEEIAHANQDLFKLIAELPPKPFQMDLETPDGNIKIQIQPEMTLYLNGREEKKRAN